MTSSPTPRGLIAPGPTCALLDRPQPSRVPVATYRLQLGTGLTFDDAAALCDYLDELGISDLYTSPVGMARAGSTHGYDVVAHGRLNPELGGEEAFRRLGTTLRARGMGLMIDLVPNHMCIAGGHNRWWLDVLEHGPGSGCAGFFDIDWHPPKPELDGRVLLPVLGDQVGRVLERGELAVVYENGAFQLRCNGTLLPLSPGTWAAVLDPALTALRARLGDEATPVLELESIIRALSHLPPRDVVAIARLRERQHEDAMIRRRLSALVQDCPEAQRCIHAAMGDLNGRPGEPRSFDALERLIAEQSYRLSHWRVAAHEINYRRFFDINDLAAIRVEDPTVFAAVHELPFSLAAQGLITGLRIDHVDGLHDPERYLHDLQQGWQRAVGGGSPYVVVEKILAPRERLPPEWAVVGTTGYDQLNTITGVLIDNAAGARLRQQTARWCGTRTRYADVVYESKRLVLEAVMASELTVLARRLDHISEQHRYTRDLTLNSLHELLREVIACFPVYRTYIRPHDVSVSERDREAIETALRQARQRNPVVAEALFDFLRSVLLLQHPEGLSEAEREERRAFVLRFQQLTGPVMAKGVEDTAFYRHVPLTALNEVGGEPDTFGITLEEFHRRNVERAAVVPLGLSATATHDTKRGEDTRARLCVLSEIPDEWAHALERWRAMNEPHRADLGGDSVPDAVEECLYYQTLVGAWPLGGSDATFVARIKAYMLKALLEAKVHTSWVNQNVTYQDAVMRFVDATLDSARSGLFLDDFTRFQAKVASAGIWNGLVQVLLKVTLPGVPDFYQGTELWDLSLVDPDNRKPVDFEVRRALLAQLRTELGDQPAALAARLVARPDQSDGALKMFVLTQALRCRRHRRALFEHGGYEPVSVLGPAAHQVIAFARIGADDGALVLTGRHFTRVRSTGAPVGDAWSDTKILLPRALGDRRWRDVLTGRDLPTPEPASRALPLREIFATLPVAILMPL